MQFDSPSPVGPASRDLRHLGPLTLLVAGFLATYLVSDGTFLGPDWAGRWLNPWLAGLFEPEGVHAARDFGVKLCALPIAIGFFWLISYYVKPVDARTRRLVQAKRDQANAFGFVLFSLFVVITTLLGEGSLLAWGRLLGLGVGVGMTLLSVWLLVRQLRRNRALRVELGESDPTAPTR